MSNQVEIVQRVTRQFCVEFIQHPYLCYTEHGLHALFYTMLYNALPADQRYTAWYGQKICVVQKEYPTAGFLGKPKRQHWDIALIKTPPQSGFSKVTASYDYLKLAVVVEFGMNEAEEHLIDDIERVCHHQANIEQGLIVHLYRLSTAGAKLSNRDWSSNSKRILTQGKVVKLTLGKPVDVFYALHDTTGNYGCGAWVIRGGTIEPMSK